jgi:hypothetical protein
VPRATLGRTSGFRRGSSLTGKIRVGPAHGYRDLSKTGSQVKGVIELHLLNRRRLRILACAALFCAALMRFWVHYDLSDSVPRGPETFRIAWNLFEKNAFANPFDPLHTGPTAHIAPVFPAVLAFLMHLFGSGPSGMYAIKMTATILLAGNMALLPEVSRVVGMGWLNGFIAAIIWIAGKVGLSYPPNHQAVPMYAWDSFYAATLLMIGIYCCRLYLDDRWGRSTIFSALIGLVLGLLLLTSPTTGFALLGCVVFAAWRAMRDGRSSWNLLATLLLPLLVVSPWLIRNYLVFGRLVFVRDNFGLELSVGNNDCARFGIQESFRNGCYFKVHPNVNLDEANSVLSYGEPEYNQIKLKAARRWITDHPKRFAELTVLRLAAFWFPPASDKPWLWGIGRRLERSVVYVMTVLSSIGFVMLYKKDKESTVLCALALILFSLSYYVVNFEYRYRYPAMWLTFLLGSMPLTAVLRRWVPAPSVRGATAGHSLSG